MKNNWKKRLDKLISLMESYKIDALLIHNKDEYQCEYPKRNRLQWLCNFSGSNGTLILTLKNNHHFFTDGRYTLQAHKELDTQYTIYDTNYIKPYKWVEDNLSSKEVLGYEDQLFTLSQIENYKNKSFSLKPITTILIDQLWQNTTPSTQKVMNHPLKYAGESTKEKLIKILAQFTNEKALLITNNESITWLTNTRNYSFHYTPTIFAKALLYKNGNLKLFVDRVEDFINKINSTIQIFHSSNLLTELKNIDNLGIDKSTITMNIVNEIKNKNLIIKNLDSCSLLRAHKNHCEINGAIKSHIRDGIAVVNFLHWLHKSLDNNQKITELSAENQLLIFRKEQKNFQGESFATISAFAENAAIIHYKAKIDTNKIINKNGLYLIDSGGQYIDGTTDITRTLLIGKATTEQKDNFTRVLKGHIAVSLCTFPNGISGEQIDILARQYLWREGLDYSHGTGHGVGSFLSVHEGPQGICYHNKIPLAEGMILSNEPGYYKSGEYGIRIENLMYIHKNSNGFLEFKQLTCVPIDINLLNISMLNKDEINYINNYHSFIYSVLSNKLNREVRLWLHKACTAIT